MEFDHYLIWFVDSLKNSVENDTVNEKTLNKNVESCFQRIKMACSGASKEEDFEKLRIKAVLVLLLCCPSIKNHPVIEASKEFQLLVSSLPNLKESEFLSVVKSQRCYRCLIYLISYLPATYLPTLIKEYFKYTDGVTPVTLAMSLELFTSFLLSWQSEPHTEKYESEILECIDLFVNFLASKNVSSSSKLLIKFSAYYFMYLTKYFLLVLSVYVGKKIECPEIPKSVEKWRNIWRTEVSVSPPRSNLFVKDAVTALLKLCQQNNEAVSVSLWMEWSEIILPPSVIPHKASVNHSGKAVEKSIQSVLCNIAFDITNLFDMHPSALELLKNVDCQEFLQFMKHVACDPDYDPDNDLSIDQLVEQIDLKDEREEKLLEILFNKEGVYLSSQCIDCVKNHASKVSVETRREALLKFINHRKDGNQYITEWQEFILELCQEIPSADLMTIIVDHLDSGQNEILKTGNFNGHSVAIFNQLVGESAPAAQDKHIWLCLQSGKDVVQQAVTMPITLPGLVPVMVKALFAITEVCQATSQSGMSLVANSLKQVQSNGICGREETDFAELVKGLMNKSVLPIKEALHELIEPYLQMQSEKSVETLILPVALLKNIIDHHIATVVHSGVELNSLLISLMRLISNTVYLQGPKASIVLELRVDAEYIISAIAKKMAENIQFFEKDILLLKQVIREQKLHPRSFLPLANLLECTKCQDSCVDRMLYLMNQREWNRSYTNQQGFGSDDLDLDLSSPEWILVLLQILPHSSESEWVSGMFLTHQFLKSGQVTYPTLCVMQELLHIVCSSSVENSLDDENVDEIDIPRLPSLSIQHCFKCFSSSAMVYIQELLKTDPSSKRFQELCNIFKWWCQIVPVFLCHAELPTLFLLQICMSIEEIISSGKLKVNKVEETVNNRSDRSLVVEKELDTQDAESPLHETNALVEQNDKAASENQSEIKGKEELQGGKNHKHNKHTLSSECFQVQIEQLMFYLVKYVPGSNVARTVGSKLKNLYEIAV